MRIGVDLGGTKIEAAALDDRGEILLRRRIATPQQDYRATTQAIARLIQGLETSLGRRGTVGVGIPGALSLASGLVKNANSTCLIGQPLDRDLAGLLGRPVRLANDANCFALSEASDGAGRDARTLFGVILGTGVGGGLVVDGQVLQGRNAIAGEWGHNPLPAPRDEERPGPPCYCGRRGCVETFLSGPALTRSWQVECGDRSAAQGVDGLLHAAKAGDPRAEAVLQRYEDRLARALAQVINIFDPDVIVLGGGLSNLSRLYDRLPAALAPHVFSDQVTTEIRPPCHGDSSGVRGAAWLWSLEEADDPDLWGSTAEAR